MAEETKKSNRLLSLDTYRGLVLVLLMLESVVYGWQHTLAEKSPSWFTEFIEFHASHVYWAGCSFWDLIQPSFMFMVGVSMAYSFGKRKRMGDSFGTMLRHAIVRALILIGLGIFLRTTYTPTTNWTFEDVITQIGLGYVFLFLLWDKSIRTQLIAAGAILVGYWALFAFWPIGEPISKDAGWGEGNESKYLLDGFFAHWNINANPGHYFDQKLLNLFPRKEPFEYHGEGYNTLNFIPSLAIMIFGLVVGEILRSDRSEGSKLKTFLIWGVAGIALGAVLHLVGVCPLVKKVWTSGFTLFSGGWCLLILAALYYIIDIKKVQKWTFPFIVVGMNSIALYCMLWLLGGGMPIEGSEHMHWYHFVDVTLQKHLGSGYAGFLGEALEPLMKNVINGILLWLVCFWMYRKKLFIRI